MKVVCRQPGCGYQVRVTRKWLELGTPRCPVAGHGSMALEQEMRVVDGVTGDLAERGDGNAAAHGPEAGPAA